jgi:hypothetical protein
VRVFSHEGEAVIKKDTTQRQGSARGQSQQESMVKEKLVLTEEEVTYLARYFDLPNEEIDRLRRKGLTEEEMAHIRNFLRRTDEQIADLRRRGRTLKDQLYGRRFVWMEDEFPGALSADEVAKIDAQNAVDRDRALSLLAARAVVTRAVCRELLESGGDGIRSRNALAFLHQWIRDTFQQFAHAWPSALNGLDAMVVPADCEGLLREIRDGAEVCDALFMLMTADNVDAESDARKLAERLDDYWKTHGQIVNPRWP